MSADYIDSKFETAGIGTDMEGHMAALKHYSSQCSSVVEFGVYDCTSTWALLAGRPAKLTSYDIARRDEVAEVEQAAKNSATEFKFVLASTLETEIEPADLLFIDSEHTYDHLKKELELHAGKIKKFILFHDTTEFGHKDASTYSGKGLQPAIDEFMAACPEWHVREVFTHCHGLTVLEKR